MLPGRVGGLASGSTFTRMYYPECRRTRRRALTMPFGWRWKSARSKSPPSPLDHGLPASTEIDSLTNENETLRSGAFPNETRDDGVSGVSEGNGVTALQSVEQAIRKRKRGPTFVDPLAPTPRNSY